MHFPKVVMNDITKRRNADQVVDQQDEGMDSGAAAQAAAAAVHQMYEGVIEAIRNNRSLTSAQRAGLIMAYRGKSKAEAKQASQRVMDAAKAARKFRRQMQKPSRGYG